MDYLCNCKSEIGNVCNPVEDHCLRATKIVHHHANGRFDWLISGQQSVYPSREVIPILSGKYKRFTFVHRVADSNFHVAGNFFETIDAKLVFVSIISNSKEFRQLSSKNNSTCIAFSEETLQKNTMNSPFWK